MSLVDSASSESEVTGLIAALDEVAAAPLSCLSSDVLASRVVVLESARARLDAVLSVTLAEADAAGVPANHGLRTIDQFVASRTHVDPSIVRADARLGRWLFDFPDFQDAFLRGEVSAAHLHALRKTDCIRVHAAMQCDQQLFLRFVETLEWKSFTNAVAYWLIANDPDGDIPDAQIADNSLTVSTLPDGTVRFSGRLDPISGGVFKHQLAVEEQRLFRADATNKVARRADHRRAEALVTIAAKSARTTDGSPAAPLVHLTMSKSVADDALRRLAEPSNEPLPVEFDDVDGRCELVDGTPIHPKLALILLATARMRRQVMNSKSRSLDLGTTTRQAPEWMRTAIFVEARGQCRTAGCDSPFSWLEADHREPASKHGPTAVRNLDALCSPDNKWKSDGPPLPER